MRSTFKGQMKQESIFLQIEQFCTVALLMHFGFSLNVNVAPDGKLSSGLIWRQNNVKPRASGDNVHHLPQLEEDICMKAISQEKIGAKAAMGLGLVKVPKEQGGQLLVIPHSLYTPKCKWRRGRCAVFQRDGHPLPEKMLLDFCL